MPITILLLTILSGICLLLWGLRTVKRAILRGYGGGLQDVIAKGTKSRIHAMLSGLGVTLLLQSSTATALLASSFVSRAMMGTAAGIAVMIGADIGTSVVAQVLSFRIDWLAPLLLSSGIIYHLIFDDGGRRRYQARILIGFGFMLSALAIIREAAQPLAHSEVLPLILAPMVSEPILALIVAIVLTYLFHSSLSAVLLFASLALGGILPLDLGLVFIIGANIGGAFIPLVAVLKDKPEALQVPLGNLLMKLVVGFAVLIAIPYYMDYVEGTEMDISRQLILAHMGFNFAIAIVFLPFVKTIGNICIKLCPAKLGTDADDLKPKYLDMKAINTPAIALSCAVRETLHMAEILEEMLKNSLNAFESNNRKVVNDLKKQDDALDDLFLAIKDYLIKLSQEELDDAEAAQLMSILGFATNLEHCGDILDKSLMELAHKKIQQQDTFSKAGFQEITSFRDKVLENFSLAQNVFLNRDEETANLIIANKRALKKAERESALNHMERLRNALPQTIATSELHMDVLRDFRRINTYISSVTYDIVKDVPY